MEDELVRESIEKVKVGDKEVGDSDHHPLDM